MIQADTHIRVRYSETDKMGFVYYGHYPAYYEVGRTELMRSYGLTYKYLEDNGIMMPVLSINIRYKKPAYYDDLLTVRTLVKDMPTAKIRFIYEVYRESGELINEGDTVLAFIRASDQRPTRPPHFFTERLKKLLDAS